MDLITVLIVIYLIGFVMALGVVAAIAKDEPEFVEPSIWVALLWPIFFTLGLLATACVPTYLLTRWVIKKAGSQS